MLSYFLTGGGIPLILMLCGIFFLFYLRGSPFRYPKRIFRAIREGGEGGSSPFRSLMLALAGTLGVGNIVGVANAVYLGGAGAVFWMWISALLAMILKYAEILLAVAHRRVDRRGNFFGGAVYYIKDCFRSRGYRRLAVAASSAFAALMILDALSMGCVVQVNAVSSALSGVLQIPPLCSGILLIVLSLPLLIKGSKSISALTEYLVPIMTAGYLVLSIAVLILKWDGVGAVLRDIFYQAFSPTSALGGVAGFLTSQALRVGTMRGLLSNEGGCGTAPIAHASANTKSPASQGVWGIFEVFVDTILLCTATALVILLAGEDALLWGSNGVMMTVKAYSSVLGPFAEYFFSVAVFCFGYATVLCWGGYGLESLQFLSCKKRWKWLYFLCVSVCVLWGAIAAPEGIWGIADFSIASLTTINLLTLFLMRKEIREETARWATA